MRKKLKDLPLILLFSAIALSPSFSVGRFGGGKIIEIRIEDILIVILGLIWLVNILISGKKRLEKPPLFFPILIWLSIGFVSVLTNWFFRNLSFDRGFFYFLKCLEFFIFYFYIFYHLKNIESAKFITNFLIFLGTVNVGYVVYQAITGLQVGEYGAGAVGERGVFPTGAFFLIFFVFFLNIFLYYFLNLNISILKKGILGIIAMGPALGVFGSDSKTNFLGLVFALFLTLFFLFLRKKSFKLILVSILILILVAFIFIFALNHIRFVSRLFPMFFPSRIIADFIRGRLIFIKPVFKEALERPLFLFFGSGIGYLGESHNQYVRNLVETGIIGSLAFLFLIWIIIKKSFKIYSKSRDGFSLGLSAGLLVATLTMLFLSVATDSFIVVKLASVYWSFTAVTMAVIYVNQREYLRHYNKS